ncbi:MAG: envelope stress response membrane protein PspB [Rhodospirillaceae bacterium]|nr:envelope stress response membrane protein PspB [Rhodospirillaceae bacterium]
MSEMIFVPSILFLVIVVPLWLILNYLTQARRERMGLREPSSPEEQELMTRMVTLLEKMEGRIGTLEKILDAENPRWRERQ